MSYLTPSAFIDDGTSLRKSPPHGLQPNQVAKWVSDTRPATTTTVTDSFFDDGGNMRKPSRSRSASGEVDRHGRGRKKSDSGGRFWDDDVKKAVTGDMQRNLVSMRDVASLNVLKVDMPKVEQPVLESALEKEVTVAVPMPRKWGTFIIEAEDGRVIVVDEHGEFDSKSQASACHETKEERWARTLSLMDVPSFTHALTQYAPPKHTDKSKEHSRDSQVKHSRSRSQKLKHLLDPNQALAPIQEVSHESDAHTSIVNGFATPSVEYMTGGASGWPSNTSTSVKSRAGSTQSASKSSVTSLSYKNGNSSYRSPPGARPTSPTKESSDSESVWSRADPTQSKGAHKSRHSISDTPDKIWKHRSDKVSTKTYSTYKPATVETISDTSSKLANTSGGTQWSAKAREDASAYQDMKSNGENSSYDSKKKSSKSKAGDVIGSKEYALRNVRFIDDKAWTASQASSDRSAASLHRWKKHYSTSGSEQTEEGSRHRSDRSRTGSDVSSHRRRRSRTNGSVSTWDGYERPKDLSEVGNAGSGSEISWPSSRAASHQTRDGRSSQRRHMDDRYRPDSLRGSVDSWVLSQTSTVSGRSDDGMEDDWTTDD